MFNLFQIKNSKAEKDATFAETTLKIEGMHCSSCAMNIDVEIEETEGVISSDTSYKNSKTTVKFDPKKIDKKKLIEIVERLDYQAK